MDTGVDDALAILLACASDDVDLLAITCVAGNTRLADVITNTTALMGLAGRSDVPVAAGRDRALVRVPVGVDNSWVHGGNGRGYATVRENRRAVADIDATDLLIAEAQARPGEVTLITTGPLTNLALAVRREPRLPELLKRWIYMGGAYRTHGNVTPAAEFNVHTDPEAAKIALEAFTGAPLRPTAVGLDVTHQVRLLPAHIEALASAAGDVLAVRPGTTSWGTPNNPIMKYLEGALRKYAEYHHKFHGFYGTYLHDAVTVAVMLDPTLVATRPVAVDVECAGKLTSGQTVADWQNVWQAEPNVDVAVSIDVERSLAALVDGISVMLASS
ncbi:nucleoside hydrolase [Rugosimonospora africana]|uniref:nucleoside hydrolase n=1 Tax=Rugosimonospora africana TaxID=556532 RepID=UPI0019431756|nr:nucleoside hydrolase [Rugosimonospora africana]